MLWCSPGDNKIMHLFETAKLIPFKNTSKWQYHTENFLDALWRHNRWDESIQAKESQLGSDLNYSSKVSRTSGVPGWMILSKSGWVHRAVAGSGGLFKATGVLMFWLCGRINAPGRLPVWTAVPWEHEEHHTEGDVDVCRFVQRLFG